MLVIPAIDIKAGSVVRLLHGDLRFQTVYSADPVEMAQKWQSQGAQRLHVVDLDGATTGAVAHLDLVYKIKEAFTGIVQFGGGLRDPDTVKKVLQKGIGRVIVGTAILKFPQWVRSALQEFPGRLMASVDAVDGEVMIEGWQAGSGQTLEDVIKTIDELGFREIVYTDIKHDGALKGPNIAGIEAVMKMTHMGIFASGGITTAQDLKTLKALEPHGLKGCIIGKALYEGKINLAEAIDLVK